MNHTTVGRLVFLRRKIAITVTPSGAKHDHRIIARFPVKHVLSFNEFMRRRDKNPIDLRRDNNPSARETWRVSRTIYWNFFIPLQRGIFPCETSNLFARDNTI